ncbi:hypothetical protein TNCV_4248291 [Trichonephila clavipes]|nr:hypothetical protein TNCV_4248291 [Trichonephila clavipes]
MSECVLRTTPVQRLRDARDKEEDFIDCLGWLGGRWGTGGVLACICDSIVISIEIEGFIAEEHTSPVAASKQLDKIQSTLSMMWGQCAVTGEDMARDVLRANWARVQGLGYNGGLVSFSTQL